MIVVKQDGHGNIISETGEEEPQLKSVYTRNAFISMIPKPMIRQIKTLAETDDDVEFWLFNLQFITEIDMNDLPAWFGEGLDAMVAGGLLTQGQVDSFLER